MSGRKNALPPYTLISAVSMGASITSTAIGGGAVGAGVQFLDNVSIQLHWTGTPTGTFDFQASDDNTNWVSLPLSASIAATGAADDAMVDLNQIPHVYVRVVYTRTSGTGTLTALASAKMV